MTLQPGQDPAFLRSVLALIPSGLIVRQVLPEPDRVAIFTDPRGASAACPLCRRKTSRVHSRYDRTFTDLPWPGRCVTIMVRARRFRCGTIGCARKVFAERLSGVVARHARRTGRLAEIQRHIGLALGGAAGARLASRLALPVSGATLLRLVRRYTGDDVPLAPQVIAIDDWAWKRGQRYGTVVCDLERRRIMDLLPDRATSTVEAWLSAHPGISVIARDRGGGYGHAASRAVAHAVQVADRWHLIENASAAFLDAVRRSMRPIRDAVGAAVVDPSVLTCVEQRQYDGFLRREQMTADIRGLIAAGTSIKEIVRRTGHSRKLVRNWRGNATCRRAPEDWIIPATTRRGVSVI